MPFHARSRTVTVFQPVVDWRFAANPAVENTWAFRRV
jgi:hypothetical protein